MVSAKVLSCLALIGVDDDDDDDDDDDGLLRDFLPVWVQHLASGAEGVGGQGRGVLRAHRRDLLAVRRCGYHLVHHPGLRSVLLRVAESIMLSPTGCEVAGCDRVILVQGGRQDVSFGGGDVGAAIAMLGTAGVVVFRWWSASSSCSLSLAWRWYCRTRPLFTQYRQDGGCSLEAATCSIVSSVLTLRSMYTAES